MRKSEIVWLLIRCSGLVLVAWSIPSLMRGGLFISLSYDFYLDMAETTDAQMTVMAETTALIVLGLGKLIAGIYLLIRGSTIFRLLMRENQKANQHMPNK